MNKIILFTVLSMILMLAGCRNTPEKWPSVALEPDTPAWEFAVALAGKIDYLDPQKNNVLASSELFDIRTSDVVAHIQLTLYQYQHLYKGASATVLEPQVQRVVNSLAEHKLLLREAQKTGITITQTEIDSVTERNYKNSRGKERYLRILESIGFDEARANAEVKNQLMVRRYLEDVLYEGLTSTESEIIEFYRQDRSATVRHILFVTENRSESEKKELYQKLTDILAEARAGADFAELAKEHSQDPSSRGKGGLLANFGRGAMVPEFDKVAFSLEPGTISDIVETRFGYHIIKVVERFKDKRPLGEAREEIVKKLTDQKRKDAYLEKVKQLKADYGYVLTDFTTQS